MYRTEREASGLPFFSKTFQDRFTAELPYFFQSHQFFGAEVGGREGAAVTDDPKNKPCHDLSIFVIYRLITSISIESARINRLLLLLLQKKTHLQSVAKREHSCDQSITTEKKKPLNSHDILPTPRAPKTTTETHQVAVPVYVVDPAHGGPELVGLHPRCRERGCLARVTPVPVVREAHLPRMRGALQRTANWMTKGGEIAVRFFHARAKTICVGALCIRGSFFFCLFFLGGGRVHCAYR